MSSLSKKFRNATEALVLVGTFYSAGILLPRPAMAQSLDSQNFHHWAPTTERDLGGGFVEFLFERPAAPVPLYRRRRDQEEKYRRHIIPRHEDNVRLDFDRPMRAPIESVRRTEIAPQFLPVRVAYRGPESFGTIVVDTPHHFLYLVEENGTARRYGIGVGRPGFTWSGVHRVSAMREWPTWTPPEEMRRRQPNLPLSMPGGRNNPLGARALYLGSTLYRIHGSNEPWTIGHNVSSGCIRMRNADVIDLYDRVKVGAKVIVL